MAAEAQLEAKRGQPAILAQCLVGPRHSRLVGDRQPDALRDFGFEIDKLAAAAQFAAFDVKSVVAKRQNHAPLLEPSRRGPEPITRLP